MRVRAWKKRSTHFVQCQKPGGSCRIRIRRRVVHERRELAVHVCGEPEGGAHAAHEVHGVGVAQLAAVDILLQEGLGPQQLLQVAVVAHALRPVVAQHDVHAPADEHELGKVVLPDVVARVQRAALVPACASGEGSTGRVLGAGWWEVRSVWCVVCGVWCVVCVVWWVVCGVCCVVGGV